MILKILPKIWHYLIIAILLFILFFKGCDAEKEPQKVKVKVPEQKGSFEPQKPEHKDSDTIYITKWKEVEVPTPNPVNEELVAAYQKAKDSLERYKMYLDAIQIREFISEYEDDHLKLTFKGQVQGEVKSIVPSYTIKERTVEAEVTPKQTVFRLLAGAEIGNNTELSDFRYKFNLGFQNAKGDVIRGSYARQFGTDYIYLGYDFSVLQIKR